MHCKEPEAEVEMLEESPRNRAQEKNALIEGLKLQVEEADKEYKKLQEGLREWKQTLKELQAKLREKEGPLAYAVKEGTNKKKGRKK
jgi:chromosome segregation ATPase